MEIFIRDEDIGKKVIFKKDIDNKYIMKLNNIEEITCISLDLNDNEVRADEKKKVCEELLEWADSKMMDWINSPKYREPRFRGTRIIHYCDLQQKLNEMKGE